MNGLIRYVTQTAWAMDETVLGNLTDIVLRHASGTKLSPEAVSAIAMNRPAVRDEKKAGPVAVIPVHGVISKYSAGVGDISQPAGTSCQAVRAALNAAMADDDVKCIVLDFETPGGSVDGVAELGDAIRTARADKKIVAFANDMCASAGYWCAAQCEEIVATQAAAVGSIGVFAVTMDTSGAAERAGVKVRVISAGAHKGDFTRGAPVTDEMISEAQRRIDAIYGLFVQAVADGRRITLDAAMSLADGRVHTGAEAKALGLVDRIGTFEQTINRLTAEAVEKSMPAIMENAMPEPKAAAVTDPQPAQSVTAVAPVAPKLTLDQFSAHFAGEDAEKVELAYHRGNSIESTQAKFAKAAAEKAIAEANAARAEAVAAKAENESLKARLASAPRGNDAASGSPPAAQGGTSITSPTSPDRIKHFTKYDDGTPYGTAGAGIEAYKNGPKSINAFRKANGMAPVD